MNKTFSVFETIGESWRLTKGAKWAIFSPLLCLFLAELLAVVVVLGGIAILHAMGLSAEVMTAISVLVGIALGITLIYLLAGLFAGMMKVSIERGRGNSVSGKSGLHSFSRVTPVLLTLILFVLFLLPGSLVQFIPGLDNKNVETQIIVTSIQMIYDLIVIPFLYLSLPFAVDKINSPFTAIASSFKAVRGNWSKLVGLFVMVDLIFLVFMLPFFLGSVFNIEAIAIIGGIFFAVSYIWLFPFMCIVQGVIYHKLAD
ncbi:MAG TPA: hypothetical protein VGV92_04495 [Gammaproteobacteria bacterium]|nr:hypothetical protein [Gammaproteobacteria bacterium]